MPSFGIVFFSSLPYLTNKYTPKKAQARRKKIYPIAPPQELLLLLYTEIEKKAT